MVLFLVTFLSCLLKFSMALVVYISFLIPSGYLKYVDSSAQLFFQELMHIGYFLSHPCVKYWIHFFDPTMKKSRQTYPLFTFLYVFI